MSSSSRKLRKTEKEELISQQRKMLIKRFQKYLKYRYLCRLIFKFWPHKLRGGGSKNHFDSFDIVFIVKVSKCSIRNPYFCAFVLDQFSASSVTTLTETRC